MSLHWCEKKKKKKKGEKKKKTWDLPCIALNNLEMFSLLAPMKHGRRNVIIQADIRAEDSRGCAVLLTAALMPAHIVGK